jgi:hypothetical protein
MELTLTIEEAKSRTAYDLIQEAAQTQPPLIVMLENGPGVIIQQYAPEVHSSAEMPLTLKPLLTLPGYVPDGWEDAIYDERH